MKTWLRRILIAVVVLVVLVAGALTYLVATFDANRYKGVAIDWMKTHRNRTLTLDGPIGLSVFPRIEVTLSKVGLSERGRAERFAAIDEASMAVELLPLLRRELVVDRVAARGVSVVYTRDAKGVRNIDDLIAPEPAAPNAPAQPPSAGGPALRFDVSRIDLADVKATIRDELIPARGDVVLESLTTGRLADRTESPVELKVRVAMQEPAVQGQLSGATRLRLDVGTSSVSLAGMQLAWQGDVPGAKALDVVLKGALAYDGAKSALQATDLDLALGGTAGPIKLAGSSVKAALFQFDPARKALALSKLQVRLAGTQASDRFGVELDWPSLAVTGDQLQGSALSGKVSLAGSNTINGTFQSGAPSGTFDQVQLPGVALALDGKLGPRTMDGKLTSNVVLRPAQAAVALDKLALQAKLNEPGLQPLALDVAGAVQASAKEAHWKLAGKLNTNQFDMDGKALLAGKVPQVQLQAKFDALDINKILGAPSAPEGGASAPAPQQPAPPDAPVDLKVLESLQGQFALRAGSLVFRQYKVTNAVLDATLEGGVLRITRLSGQSWGGKIDASGFADSRASKVGVKLAADAVNINALLKDVADKDLMEGIGRVTADLQTSGKTVSEMRSKLAGNAALQLRDGAVKGVNLAKSLRRAKAALGGGGDDAVEKAKQTEKTDFSELVASFQIADGVAKSNDLEAKSPFLRLGGAGLADVGKGRIDYTARATVTNTSKGQEGADLEALKGLTVPVLLSGPFDAIDWKVQWSAIAGDLAKNKVEDKLKDKLGAKLGLKPAAPAASGAAAAASGPQPSAKQQVKDQVKDKLKGLFK